MQRYKEFRTLSEKREIIFLINVNEQSLDVLVSQNVKFFLGYKSARMPECPNAR